MNRSKIVLLGGIVVVALIILVVTGWSPKVAPRPNPVVDLSQPSSEQFSSPLPFGNGFASGPDGTSLSGQQNAPPPTFNGKPVESLGDVANIITKTPPPAPVASVPLLAMPAVSDSEITTDTSGVATTLDFLSYFNGHSSQDIVFDNKRFESVLKDNNGVVLFTPELIDKAIADNNFTEIQASLAVQKDYANAEIAFLRGIKVSAGAVAFDKQIIGSEKLLLEVIDKGLAVGAGTLKKDDFVSFYGQFLTTMGVARGQLIAKTSLLSLGESKSWLSNLNDLLFGARALAATSTSQGGSSSGGIGGFSNIAGAIASFLITPFGGRIGVPVPCPCDAGYWIIVGPPKPVSLFVPFSFIATPLFFANRSLVPGTWWLGISNRLLQIPCLSGAACTPAGLGQVVIMAGTSLPE